MPESPSPTGAASPIAMIGLDWGTSRLRAYAIGHDGDVLDQATSDRGIATVEPGGHAGIAASLVGPWRAVHPAIPLLVCGMAGARQGWRETPYCPLPATADSLARGLVEIRIDDLGTVHLVPGVAQSGAAADVMRGEETQIVGALPGGGTMLACLPGTHSKWVDVAGGRIERFATFMTGEIFATMTRHTILARTIEGNTHDEAAFRDGIRRAEQPGGFLHHIFAGRSRPLLGDLDPEQVSSYLSGMTIGREILDAVDLLGKPVSPVMIIGDGALPELYLSAFDCLGLSATIADTTAAARGVYRIATAAGLLPGEP